MLLRNKVGLEKRPENHSFVKNRRYIKTNILMLLVEQNWESGMPTWRHLTFYLLSIVLSHRSVSFQNLLLLLSQNLLPHELFTLIWLWNSSINHISIPRKCLLCWQRQQEWGNNLFLNISSRQGRYNYEHGDWFLRDSF